ncbi:aminoglycoside phosphotransferase [Microbacterium sp. 10M-3C3]|jgi:predicted trehalose synthase|uniref:maltokinase N-terminal cap-like domain-containing protein n=1 Tax=Microbacterium sp. 10M-3C3 TaxID=2483401 RepID=UPI000F637550|nr:aminoglycoside phosphotransferase [Microbacterium sp. 10M-3C3]
MENLLARLTEWMPRQRWYTGKGTVPALTLVARWDLGSTAQTRAELLLVGDAGGAVPVVYQVPVVIRADSPGDATVIGEIDGGVLTDGAHDPAFHDILHAWLTGGATIAGDVGPVHAEPAHDGRATGAHVSGAVLSGEQSNTSIILRTDDGAPVICKLFRQVHAGVNPDIELQVALSDAGIRAVPPAVGTVSAVWHDPRAATVVSGSLAFAQEFFPGVEDAWRVALRAAASGSDFSDSARSLGRAVADVHAALARLFPTAEATDLARAGAVAGWRGRLDAAVDAVPELAALRPGIEAVFGRAQAVPWPRLQRVHGDLHLGQVLDVPGRGWVLLDFEGEPLRPIAERLSPDFAVRDVAGMLRSFAYVASSVPATEHADPARWAESARRAFLDGYAASPAAAPLTEELVRAFELDKALYETVYEARNRPDWLHIPLSAVRRMAG